MNLIKTLLLASAVALAPTFALAQTAPATGTTGATQPGATAPADQRGERKGRKGGERGERFKKADTNGDGAISITELDSYIASRVKDLTKGTQHPVTRKPGTIPDYPIALLR